MQINSPSAAYTEKVGAALSQILPAASIIRLIGGLGLGKTVLAHGLARGLGIQEPVTSPTYTIIQEYQGVKGNPGLIHVDLYRIQDEEELDELGLIEMIGDPGYVMLIEWADRVAETFFPGALTVKMGLGRTPDERVLEVSADLPGFKHVLGQQKEIHS